MAQAEPAAVAANDPRVTGLLRWSAGISGPLILACLVGIAGTLINLRDESRQMKYEIRQIAVSDNNQQQTIKQLTAEHQALQLTMAEHNIRLRAVEAKAGVR